MNGDTTAVTVAQIACIHYISTSNIKSYCWVFVTPQYRASHIMHNIISPSRLGEPWFQRATNTNTLYDINRWGGLGLLECMWSQHIDIINAHSATRDCMSKNGTLNGWLPPNDVQHGPTASSHSSLYGKSYSRQIFSYTSPKWIHLIAIVIGSKDNHITSMRWRIAQQKDDDRLTRRVRTKTHWFTCEYKIYSHARSQRQSHNRIIVRCINTKCAQQQQQSRGAKIRESSQHTMYISIIHSHPFAPWRHITHQNRHLAAAAASPKSTFIWQQWR